MKNKSNHHTLFFFTGLVTGGLAGLFTMQIHGTQVLQQQHRATTGNFLPKTKNETSLPSQDISRCQDKRKESYGITLGDIHSTNPYKNFVPEMYGVKGRDLSNWGYDFEVFDIFFNRIKPKFMVEVGSWKGNSAVNFAKKMRKIHGQEACLQLICVDTWLGTTVAWQSKDMENPDHGNTLFLRNGYPSVYYQFLYNIIDQKVDDIVIPLPLPAVMGSIFLNHFEAKPDTIYIDGCHDYICVLEDLKTWFPMVALNGFIMGDDFQRQDVKNAVSEFCTEENKCHLDSEMSSRRTFVLQKTG